MTEEEIFEQELEKTSTVNLLPMFNDEKTRITMANLVGAPVSFDRLRKICEKMNPLVTAMGFSGFVLDSDDEALWKSAVEYTKFLLR